MLLLPVMVPLFVAGVRVAALAVDGRPFNEMVRWLLLMGGFDMIVLALAWILFDLIWEDALDS